ncbi:MAG: DUF4954 family protein [Marinilabiliaceae bacterium]|jgi:hypothetical protein|nr:DUF4954 family protein [Marinilabiliaceae bacterium]
MENNYRKLSSEEIGQLIMQGCESSDWGKIEVREGFSPESIKNTNFTGYNRLGLFNDEVSLFGGVTYRTGIYNAWLNNCLVDDNVLIHNVKSYISNYHIESDVVIHNVNTIAVDGESSFGNGLKVNVLNEKGGREVPIYDHLSTHIAYILALYRHRPALIEHLEALVERYRNYVSDTRGRISSGARIINSDNLRNVKIGQAARVEGVRKLFNGSLNSSYSDPVYIGDGVIMENFIVCSGSSITDSTLISNCFVGQGCILAKQYSAVDSLFFANCQGFHGEATSIFAGPYTVTHHKSTLLIAGMFSFLNAGSGSNQSNHLYKLGPIHQGIVERGVKTTSDSYLLWPSHIGAFSLVMGRHYKHSDTSLFPFSYLIESNDRSILVPGVNLKSVGTVRDTQKWPKRDRRKDPNQLDHINFNLLSPYTVQKMLSGKEILLGLREEGRLIDGYYHYNDMQIKKDALEKGISLYTMAINKFLGNSLLTRLGGQPIKSEEDVFRLLAKDTPVGTGKWVDLSGLICPAESLNSLFEDIEAKRINSLEEINSALKSIHKNYYTYEWTWVNEMFRELTGKAIEEHSIESLRGVIEAWLDAVLQIDRYLYEDVKKEFSMHKMTGFGIDGDDEQKYNDFERVRGEFDTNEMVLVITGHMKNKEELGQSVLRVLNQFIHQTSKV